jgi:hypothetical protein
MLSGKQGARERQTIGEQCVDRGTVVEVQITAPHDLRIGRARIFDERALQVGEQGVRLTQQRVSQYARVDWPPGTTDPEREKTLGARQQKEAKPQRIMFRGTFRSSAKM